MSVNKVVDLVKKLICHLKSFQVSLLSGRSTTNYSCKCEIFSSVLTASHIPPTASLPVIWAHSDAKRQWKNCFCEYSWVIKRIKSLPVVFDLPVWKGRDWSAADILSGDFFFFSAELGHFILEFIPSPVNTKKSHWWKVKAHWSVKSCDVTSRDCLKEFKICLTKTTAAHFDTDSDHKRAKTAAWYGS